MYEKQPKNIGELAPHNSLVWQSMARRYSRGKSGVEEPVMAKKVGDWLLLPSRVGIEVA